MAKRTWNEKRHAEVQRRNSYGPRSSSMKVDDWSQPVGNAGGRQSCGVIGIVKRRWRLTPRKSAQRPMRGGETRVHVQVEGARAKVTREQSLLVESSGRRRPDDAAVWSAHPEFKACDSLKVRIYRAEREFQQHTIRADERKWKCAISPPGAVRAVARTARPARETAADWDFIGERDGPRRTRLASLRRFRANTATG